MAPQGETTHYILCVAVLLHPLLSLTHWILRSLCSPTNPVRIVHPLLSLTHWIFGSLMLPYKSSSLVQNVFAVHRLSAAGCVKWLCRKVLKIDGPAAQGLLSLTATSWLRVVEAPYGHNIKSALRDWLLCHQCCTVISSGGTSRYESHSFVEPVKGSREISSQKAALRSVTPA